MADLSSIYDVIRTLYAQEVWWGESSYKIRGDSPSDLAEALRSLAEERLPSSVYREITEVDIPKLEKRESVGGGFSFSGSFVIYFFPQKLISLYGTFRGIAFPDEGSTTFEVRNLVAFIHDYDVKSGKHQMEETRMTKGDYVDITEYTAMEGIAAKVLLDKYLYDYISALSEQAGGRVSWTLFNIASDLRSAILQLPEDEKVGKELRNLIYNGKFDPKIGNKEVVFSSKIDLHGRIQEVDLIAFCLPEGIIFIRRDV